MSDWQACGGIKVERAKDHIRYLEAEIAAYNKRRPYVAVGALEKPPAFERGVRRRYSSRFFPVLLSYKSRYQPFRVWEYPTTGTRAQGDLT